MKDFKRRDSIGQYVCIHAKSDECQRKGTLWRCFWAVFAENNVQKQCAENSSTATYKWNAIKVNKPNVGTVTAFNKNFEKIPMMKTKNVKKL